jgi:adenosine deaminase
VKVTINSDDPELLDTNLNNEFRIAHEILGMSFEDLQTCTEYAFEASFIPEAQKQAVKESLFARRIQD